MNKVIKLENGIEVEVEVEKGTLSEISSYDIVSSSLDNISLLLSKVAEPVSQAYLSIAKNIEIESSKVTVGVKFGASGNIFIAKSNAEASITVEMTLRPKNV